MAIAFYCEEEEDPKVYYDSYGYGYQLQSQQSQHAATASPATGSQQPVAQQAASGVDENNNNNCALHGSSPLPADVVNNRQLMRVVLHQVLYRCTMEGKGACFVFIFCFIYFLPMC